MERKASDMTRMIHETAFALFWAGRLRPEVTLDRMIKRYPLGYHPPRPRPALRLVVDNTVTAGAASFQE
jgi:hypothetical protein